MNKIKLYKLFATSILLIFSYFVVAQCNTNITTIPSSLDTVNCGESVQLAISLPVNALGDDFSSGSLGSIWQTSTALNYTVVQNIPNGCSPPVYCTNPQPNWVFWFTGGPAGWLTTVPLDVQCPGTLTFDYRHETQSPAPCDGPDQPNEGLYLEYRTLGGTWTTINYFVPVNSGGPIQQHCWNNYSFPITPAMYSTGTQFRVGTQTTSSANWDQWGMSNFNVALNPPCGVPYTSIITGPSVPANYTLDTITVSPATDSAIYIVNVTDGTNSCSDSVTVYIEQPSIQTSLIPALCAGSDTLNAEATITKRCNYSIVLRNYKSGGPNFPGWGTGQPFPNDYNYVDFYRNGVLTGYFTMGSGGQNATDTFPLPLVDGDLIETDFSGYGAGGPSGTECYYYIYDSQMNLVASTAYGPTPSSFWNTIDVNITNGGTGYNIPPWNAVNPQPTCSLVGGGGTYTSCIVNGVNWPNGNISSITVNGAIGYTSTPTLIINGTNTTPAIASALLNSGSNPTVGPGITVSCPVSNTYTYAWTNISTSPPSTNGLSNPNISNPVSTVAVPTQYQVIASDNNNPQCVAVDTVSVSGNPGNGNFDVALTSSNTICNDGNPFNITFQITSNSIPQINSGIFTFDLEDGSGNIIVGGIPFDASMLPFNGFVPSTALPNPLAAGTYDFVITNVQDATPCPIAINSGTISITVNNPLPIGNPPNNPIQLCTSSPLTDTLWNSWSVFPDQNGTWDYLGVTPVGIAGTLPFNGFQYSLDPGNCGFGNHIFQYQLPTVSGCPTPSPTLININITSAPDAGVLPNNIPPICINDPSLPLNLNNLFTTAPVPFSTTYWTDVTNNVPGIPINYLFTPTGAGNYTLRYTAPLTGNCPADYEEVEVVIYDIPNAIISSDDADNQICEGDNIKLIFNINNGTPNYNVNFIDPNGISNNVTLNATGNDVTTNLPIEIYPNIGSNQYTLINITDNNSCSNNSQNNVVINVIQAPDAGNPTINTICSDNFTTWDLNSAPLFTGGDLNGSWTYQGTVPPTPIPFGTFQAWDPILNNPIDPFGTYRYTVSEITGTCADAWQEITINSEQAPNTGNATNDNICLNNFSAVSPYNLNNLLDGTQDLGGSWFFNGILIPTGTIDPNDPQFNIGNIGNIFSYQITPNALISVCTNNGSLPYETQSTLIIHPTPVMDPNTFINNPPLPASVPQGNFTTITIDMLVGTPPFNIIVNGNETPTASSSNFNILGMSGTGILTPNYDINTNPVTISVDQITDNNGCIINPNINTDIFVEPWPLISANTAPVVCEENGALDLVLQAIQGAVPLTVYWEINGVPQANAQINSLNTPTLFPMLIPADLNRIAPGPVNSIVITSIIDAQGNLCPPSLLPTNLSPIEVIVNPSPEISLFNVLDSEICEGEDAVLEFNFIKGTPPFNISLNGFGIAPLTGTTNQTHTVTPQLTASLTPYNYLVTFCQDNNGCISTNIPPSIDITVNPTPEASIFSFVPNDICEGQSKNLTISINSSILAVPPIYTIEINNGLITKDIDQNGNIMNGIGSGSPIFVNPFNTTTYTITNFYDPITSCGSISPINNSVILNVNENPQVEIPNTSDTSEICAGENSYISFIFTKGTSPWTIDYNNNSVPVSLGPWSDTTTIKQVLTSTTNYDFVRVTDVEGCYTDLFDNFDIVVNPLPIASLDAENRYICDNPNSNATLKFEVFSGTLPYKIYYNVNLDNTQIPDSVGNLHTLDTNITGNYKITDVIDSKGCRAIQKGEEIKIFVNPLPIANFIAHKQPTDINDPYISFVNLSKNNPNSDSNDNLSYYWQSTNLDPSYPEVWDKSTSSYATFEHVYPGVVDTHYVTLTVTSDSGCVSTHIDTVIIDPGFKIFVPDAFTPDNDLYNDHFLPVVNGIQDYNLTIYDRYGNQVFETNDYITQNCPRGCDFTELDNEIKACIEGCSSAWDGKINGDFSPIGNFIYNIVLTDLNGKVRKFSGGITLIR